MSCTSYGTMFQVIFWPVTSTTVPWQAPAGFAHRGERFRQQIVERADNRLLPGMLGLLQRLVDDLAFARIGAAVLGRAESLDLGPQGVGLLGQHAAEPHRLRLDPGVVKLREPLLVLANRRQHRLQPLHFPVLPRPEHRLDHPLDHPARPP